MDREQLSKKARRLRELRQAAGLTQTDAARGMGVSQPALCNLENGREPTAEQAHRIARFYGVSLEDFWTPPDVEPVSALAGGPADEAA